MKYFAFTLSIVSFAGMTHGQTAFPWESQSNQNFIATTTIAKEGVTSQTNLATLEPFDYSTQIQYYDGLGRPVQTVSFGMSAAGHDIVVPIVYDYFGREVMKYLPYARNQASGSFVSSGLSEQAAFYSTSGTHANDPYPFAKTVFENSPLNRVLEQGAPGTAWQPDGSNGYNSTDATIRHAWETNGPTEVLRWNVNYPSGFALGIPDGGTASSPVYFTQNTLQRNRTKDENANEVIEYVDKMGRVVLKRVQAKSGSGLTINDTNYASTYYIYNDFGDLVCVIPPEATKHLFTEYFHSGATNSTKDTFMKRWAFRYVYDQRRRMIIKQVPGAEPVYMIYDNRDRLVLTQDGEQRLNNKWSFTKYDALNRPIMTGIYSHGSAVSREFMAGQISTTNFFETYNGNASTHGYSANVFPTTNLEVHTVTYYDNYNFLTLAGSSYQFKSNHLPGQEVEKNEFVKGQVTGSKIKVLVENPTYLWSANYYDDKYRLIQTISQNPRGHGQDQTTSIYDFVGKVEKSRTTSEGVTITRTFLYDHAGRLQLTRHKVNNNPEVVIAANYYNELGQLVTKGLHHESYPPIDEEIGEPGTVHNANIQRTAYNSSETDLIATNSVTLKPGFHVPAGSTFSARIGFTQEEAHTTALADPDGFKQVIDYRYNIRGWLEKINDPNTSDPDDLFSMKLNYNNPTASGGAAQYNGNISEIIWNTVGYDKQSYGYTYDPMNRLWKADYHNQDNASENGRYNEYIDHNDAPGYDLNGNILYLHRNGKKATVPQGNIDNLTYKYIGNQLHVVNDATADHAEEIGFRELTEKTFNAGNSTTWEYVYDANGNMIRDDNKGIDSIIYNHLNLPWKVYKSPTEYIEYTYDATGRKLKQQVFGSEAKTTDYVGELIFENGNLQFINHEEGRVVMTGLEPEYQYYLKDHLGSIRTTFSEKHSVEEYVATLETSTNPEFLNHNNRSSFTPYNHTPSGTYSQQLNGGYNGQIGLAKSFAVEPGDVFDLEVYAKYEAPTSTPADPSTLLAALFSTFSLGTGGTGLESQAAAEGFNAFFGNGDVWIGDGMYNPSAPRAYLNYILFDEEFIVADFGFQQVTDAGATAHELLSLHVKVERKGYLYVYLSNEQTVQTNVYWDDFRIVRHTGVVQVEDYYPFGLTFNSYQRENSVPNKLNKFQGQEYIDDLGLNWDSYRYRNDMPEIGRFFNIDPMASAFYYNSPYAFSENKVTTHREMEGLEAFFIHGTNADNSMWKKDVADFIMRELKPYFSTDQTADMGFKWNDVSAKPTPTQLIIGGGARNWLGNTEKRDRAIAARQLVSYILKNRKQGQQITLVGHSHGGNVAIQAARILFEKHNTSVNIVNFNTPAWNGANDPENPWDNFGIDEMLHFFTDGDYVAGPIAGENKYGGLVGSNVQQIKLNNSLKTNLIGTQQHYFENVNWQEVLIKFQSMMSFYNDLGGRAKKKKKQPNADEEACKRSGGCK